MPTGTIPTPTLRRVKVGLSDPATVIIGGLQQATITGQSTTTVEKFENAFPSYTATGPNTWELPLNGRYLVDDDGQDLVNAAFITKATVYCSVAPNGTDGRQLPGIISRLVIDTQNPDSLTAWQATISGTGDPTDIGSGL